MSLTFENLVFGKYDCIHAPPVTNVCVIGWPRLKQTPVLSCLLGESVVESGMTQSFRMTVGIPRRFFFALTVPLTSGEVVTNRPVKLGFQYISIKGTCKCISHIIFCICLN